MRPLTTDTMILMAGMLVHAMAVEHGAGKQKSVQNNAEQRCQTENPMCFHRKDRSHDHRQG